VPARLLGALRFPAPCGHVRGTRRIVVGMHEERPDQTPAGGGAGSVVVDAALRGFGALARPRRRQV